MTHRQSVDSTGTKFFTKYSDVNQCIYRSYLVNQKERSRFRSTFQASKLGDQDKMNEIQDMFNNYNLFKYAFTLFRYGQYGSGSKKRKSFA